MKKILFKTATTLYLQQYLFKTTVEVYRLPNLKSLSVVQTQKKVKYKKNEHRERIKQSCQQETLPFLFFK